MCKSIGVGPKTLGCRLTAEAILCPMSGWTSGFRLSFTALLVRESETLSVWQVVQQHALCHQRSKVCNKPEAASRLHGSAPVVPSLLVATPVLCKIWSLHSHDCSPRAKVLCPTTRSPGQLLYGLTSYGMTGVSYTFNSIRCRPERRYVW